MQLSLKKKKDFESQSESHNLGGIYLEAASRFELEYNGFADRCLTTWLCRQKKWSGKRDSNPRLQPWQGCTLPLSYSRSNDGGIFTLRWGACQPLFHGSPAVHPFLMTLLKSRGRCLELEARSGLVSSCRDALSSGCSALQLVLDKRTKSVYIKNSRSIRSCLNQLRPFARPRTMENVLVHRQGRLGVVLLDASAFFCNAVEKHRDRPLFLRKSSALGGLP